MISPLTPWQFNPVLPTVFDDSLSYLEMVSKLYKKIEEIIAEVNDIDQDAIEAALNQMRQEIQINNSAIQEKYNQLDDELKAEYEGLNSSVLELADATAQGFTQVELEI